MMNPYAIILIETR